MKTVLCAFLLFIFPCLAQDGSWIYVSGYTASTATSASVSIELASDDTRSVKGVAAVVRCADSECAVTITRGGTISAGSDIDENLTTGTRGGITLPEAQADAKSGVTITGGTPLPGAQTISGEALVEFSLTRVEIVAGESLAIKVTSTAAQDISIAVEWEELP